MANNQFLSFDIFNAAGLKEHLNGYEMLFSDLVMVKKLRFSKLVFFGKFSM